MAGIVQQVSMELEHYCQKACLVLDSSGSSYSVYPTMKEALAPQPRCLSQLVAYRVEEGGTLAGM